MLLSRKRAREPLVELPPLRHHTSGLRPHVDEKWFLRDLLHAYSSDNHHGCSNVPNKCTISHEHEHEHEQRGYARLQVVEFLHRHNRIGDHNVSGIDVCDNALQILTTTHALSAAIRFFQLSRARMSSQELFLSVVLEWQRAETQTHNHLCVLPPTATLDAFTLPTHTASYARWNIHHPASLSSESSSVSESSDSEVDDMQTRLTQRPQQLINNNDVSPISVYNVPYELSPLRLDDLTALRSTKRIGIYSPRSRHALLRKYMAKRDKRLSQKTVRYRVRKTLANARPRVKGRFVKTEQPLTAAVAESMGGSERA